MSDTPIEGLAAVIEAGQSIGDPKRGDPDVPQWVVIPEGSTIAEIDSSNWRLAPVRAKGIAKPATVDSLIEYVKRHEVAGTTVWCDLETATLTAVLDDHEPVEETGTPGYGQHRAVCELKATPQWLHWLEKDGKSMGQVEFAEHVEEGLDDIVEPEAATVLEMAQFFQANTGVAFRSSNRLQSGEQQLLYTEEVTAAAGRDGNISIPAGFKLGLEPFYGEERYALFARFRFRVASGKLQMSYHLDRPDVVRRDALEKIVERLNADVFASAKVFVGEPR
jgi:uncharacterized protein YfdQ (DUF2303 family)